VYFGRDGDVLVILLADGMRQQRDIEAAQAHWSGLQIAKEIGEVNHAWCTSMARKTWFRWRPFGAPLRTRPLVISVSRSRKAASRWLSYSRARR
jgi:hypothetical protein